MDMNASYQAFVHELFPNAELIIDRFHIIQLMGRTMDTIRTQCLKQLDKHSREYKVLKSLWRLFHKANPDAPKSRYLFGLNEYSTEILEPIRFRPSKQLMKPTSISTML